VAQVLQIEGVRHRPPRALQNQSEDETPRTGRRSEDGSNEEIAPDQGVVDLAGQKAGPGDQRLRPAAANAGFQGKVEQKHERGLYELVDEVVRAVGRDVIKVLILDRGFIDGAQMGRLQQDYRIETILPVRAKPRDRLRQIERDQYSLLENARPT